MNTRYAHTITISKLFLIFLLSFVFLLTIDYGLLPSHASAQTATESYCPNGPFPSDPISGTFTYMNVQQCNLFDNPPVCNTYNPIYTATQSTANTLAGALGASVVAVANPLGDPTHFSFSGPIYELLFPNGYQIPAGYVASLYDTGNNPATNPAVFKPILDGICGTGISGGTTGGTTGGTSGGTTSAGGVTTVSISNTSQATSVTLNTIYTATQKIAQQAILLYNQVAALQSSLSMATSTASTASTVSQTPNRSGVLSLASTTVYASGNSSIAFPVSVSVTASNLNVRSAPSTTASLAGSQTLVAGDQFVATGEVVGESVSGNNLWWVSSKGNYVWSGGTTVVGANNG